MLQNIHLKNIGPGREFSFDFGKRLNFLAGDNGLGKTFVLDWAWWFLAGVWAGRIVRPKEESQEDAIAEYTTSKQPEPLTWRWERNKGRWKQESKNPLENGGLVVYAKLDGGFSISFSQPPGTEKARKPLHLDPIEVWEGMKGTAASKFEGFYRDVSTWMAHGMQQATDLQKVADHLSPAQENLKFATPKRVYLDDTRLHPILKMPYGDVPVAECSAGIKRILALAYVLIWALREDQERANLLGIPHQSQATLLIDEIEAHLHPEWQRSIIPSLLTACHSVLGCQTSKQQVQIIVSTHSPLVLASVEPLFDETQDKLFHLKLAGNTAIVEDVIWTRHGTSSYWLTSPIFGLGEARSRQAETAIQAAKDFMVGKANKLPTNLQTKEQIHEALKNSLPGQDPFWPRWMVKTGMED